MASQTPVVALEKLKNIMSERKDRDDLADIFYNILCTNKTVEKFDGKKYETDLQWMKAIVGNLKPADPLVPELLEAADMQEEEETYEYMHCDDYRFKYGVT